MHTATMNRKEKKGLSTNLQFESKAYKRVVMASCPVQHKPFSFFSPEARNTWHFPTAWQNSACTSDVCSKMVVVAFPCLREFGENAWQFKPHLHFFVVVVEINSLTLIPLFRPNSKIECILSKTHKRLKECFLIRRNNFSSRQLPGIIRTKDKLVLLDCYT